MKSVKELLETTIDESAGVPKSPIAKNPSVPSIIVLRRKSVRAFADNQKVGLYYSDALDKYVTVPFGPDGKAQGISLSEEEQLDEALPLVPLAIQGARAALSSTVGRSVITGAAQLAQRGAAAAGRGLKSLGDRALKAVRGSKTAKDKKTTTASARGKGRLRRLTAGQKKKGFLNKLTTVAAGGDDEGRGIFNQNDQKSVTQYRETNYKVNPNTSQALPQMRRRNWDELEHAQNQRLFRTGSYTPQGSQVYESIKEIAKSGKANLIKIGEHSVNITPRIANRICECHAMLNNKNQKNFEAMLNESVPSLKKIIDFSIRKGK